MGPLPLEIDRHKLICVESTCGGVVFASSLSSIASFLLGGAGGRARSWLPSGGQSTEMPAQWRTWLHHHVPLCAQLPAELRQAHEDLVLEFVARKPFIGCAGVEVTDLMRVVVAGHACLLVLARGLGAYAQLREILVYPGQFVARRRNVGPGGVVHEHAQVLRGESSTLGQVVLSWEDVIAPAGDGHNLVVHEFAHQLDQAKGAANGAPFTRAGATQRERWARVMSAEYDRHQARVHAGEPTLLSPYGASSPAEFFAVCSELFFEMPQPMQFIHPELYFELSRYYRLDPASWEEPGAAMRSPWGHTTRADAQPDPMR